MTQTTKTTLKQKILLNVTATATALSMAAFAQAGETSPDTLAATFSSADINADAQLDSEEFITFSVKRAEAGDTMFRDLVVSGDYDAAFATHDRDANGYLSVDELMTHQSDVKTDISEPSVDFDEKPKDEMHSDPEG